MRRAGSGIVGTRWQAELCLCLHFHAMRRQAATGRPDHVITRSRSKQSKPRNCLNVSPISVAYLSPVARSLISSKREHLITLFHSQPALVSASLCGIPAERV
jgi:hypothetical protein